MRKIGGTYRRDEMQVGDMYSFGEMSMSVILIAYSNAGEGNTSGTFVSMWSNGSHGWSDGGSPVTYRGRARLDGRRIVCTMGLIRSVEGRTVAER